MSDEATKADEKVRRLSELDVREVSLVDKPAIDRTFLVTKRHDISSGAPDMPVLSSSERTFLTKSEGIVRAIANERLDMIVKALDSLKESAELTKQDVRDQLSAVFSNLYAVDSDLTALAKSFQDEGLLPGDFDFDLAKGFPPDDEEKKKAAEKAAAEKATAEKATAAEKAKAEKEAADKAKAEKDAADKAKTQKGTGEIAADLIEAIGVVAPLLEQAAAQDTAPTAQIKRVSAFLTKVVATGGAVAKGVSADNVEKGFKHMTDARVAELKAAHSSLGNLLAIFQTGKSAEASEEKADADTKKGMSTEANDILIGVLKGLSTDIATLGDRLSTVEHTRKAATGGGSEDTGGKEVEKSGSVNWTGIL